MKKITFLTVALASTTMLSAQTTIKNPDGSEFIQCSSFYETIPLRDMPAQTDQQRQNAQYMRDLIEAKRESMRPSFPHFKKQKEQPDPIVQTTTGTATITAPLVNFDGEQGSFGCPPDPCGAVGLTQYVQSINSSYQVYDKTGKALTAVIDLASLFTNIPNDDGDPIVLYDKFADRWFIAEFQVSKSPCGFSIAISKTSDATGAYYIYNFSNAAWTTSNFPDYPKFSIWSDGYYMTGQYGPEGVVVLDRARMLAGKSSAGLILTHTPTPPVYFGANNSLYTAAKTLDCDASALPPYGTPEYLVFFENTNSGGYSNSIVFMKCVHDTALKTLTVTRWDSLSPSSFNAYFTGGTEKEISQPGASKSLDVLDGTFNFRAPFMVFTTYNAVVLSNTVNTGSLIAGVRWYEIHQDPSTQHFSIYQQGTYAPSDGASRWNSSIGMDQDGDIGLQFCVSSGSVYPSIHYTGRLAADALGTITGTEQTAVTGSTPAVSCGNRWGDYSEMTLDPTDNTTFWNTNEYDNGGNQNTRVFSFQLTNPTGVNNPIDNTDFKVYAISNAINVTANKLPSNDEVQVDLFTIEGKLLSGMKVNPATNAIQTTISTVGLAKGMYFVRIGNAKYQRVFKVEVM